VIRTQVQLNEEQAQVLKYVAAQRGVSMAEVLRDLIDAHLTKPAGRDRRERAIRAVGRHRSGRHDVSREHDRDLADAFGR
jgi:hypothetical protein